MSSVALVVHVSVFAFTVSRNSIAERSGACILPSSVTQHCTGDFYTPGHFHLFHLLCLLIEVTVRNIIFYSSSLVFCVYVFVCVCAYKDMHAHVCMCMWRLEVNFMYPPQGMVHLSFEIWFLIGLGLLNLARLAGQYCGIPFCML